MKDNLTDISNVLIIGCGGAGLRAAIEAKLSGLQVTVLGKRSKFDAHTVLAAGGINAAFGNIDKEDSWEQHFSDTYIEGYGIANSKLVEHLVKEAPNAVLEIDEWGANLAKMNNGLLEQRFFGAHTYRRTCFSGDYTGQSILNALINKTKNLKIPIFDSQYVTELLINEGNCFGAMSFDTISGERTIHLADATILCTGGHTRIWKRSSSRSQENTGDGYYLALNAGCELIDMEMVQFHPTGMIYPEDIAGTLVTEAVRGEGGILTNTLGERFMSKYDKERMELSTRDKVAIANYTEILEGRGTSKGGVYLDISYKDKEFILQKIPKVYRQFIEYQMLDITKEKMQVAPTAHYSMGGIQINPTDHSTNIKGLYAAGEVAGGLHGANRLGGNSLAEILVFGKQVGSYAAKYSKNLKFQPRSSNAILTAHENIDKLMKKGDQLAISLQNNLSNVLWNYCGVIKEKTKLEIGLENVRKIETAAEGIEVRVEDRNYQDLVNTFNLLASTTTAKSTLMSALERKESRGSHQRSDFPNISSNYNKNYCIYKTNEKLKIKSKKLSLPSENLNLIINKTTAITNFQNRLLE